MSRVAMLRSVTPVFEALLRGPAKQSYGEGVKGISQSRKQRVCLPLRLWFHVDGLNDRDDGLFAVGTERITVRIDRNNTNCELASAGAKVETLLSISTRTL